MRDRRLRLAADLPMLQPTKGGKPLFRLMILKFIASKATSDRGDRDVLASRGRQDMIQDQVAAMMGAPALAHHTP